MTKEEKEQIGKYILQMARLLEDGCYQQEMLLKAVCIIDEALDQELKTGHWIDDMSLGYHVSICSNCNWRGHGDTCLMYKPKFCPNCGAKMVESQESEDA